MPRNLIVCIDGTANQYGTVNTNVVHLYKRLIKDPDRQLALYEPGVRTFSSHFGRRVDGFIGRSLGKLHDSLATIPGRSLQATHLGARPRTIEPGARIHASVEQRRQHTDYDPNPIPDDYEIASSQGGLSARKRAQPNKPRRSSCYPAASITRAAPDRDIDAACRRRSAAGIPRFPPARGGCDQRGPCAGPAGWRRPLHAGR